MHLYTRTIFYYNFMYYQINLYGKGCLNIVPAVQVVSSTSNHLIQFQEMLEEKERRLSKKVALFSKYLTFVLLDSFSPK